MRTIAPFILCVLVFSSPAYALRVDVTNRSDAGGAVVVQGDTTFAWGGSGPAEFAMTVDSEVRLNGYGVHLLLQTARQRLHYSGGVLQHGRFLEWIGNPVVGFGDERNCRRHPGREQLDNIQWSDERQLRRHGHESDGARHGWIGPLCVRGVDLLCPVCFGSPD